MQKREQGNQNLRYTDTSLGWHAGELGSLEEVVVQMLNHQPPFLKPPVLSALWQLCEGPSPRRVRNSLAIISMAAAKQPSLVSARLDLLLKVVLIYAHLYLRSPWLDLRITAFGRDRTSGGRGLAESKGLFPLIFGGAYQDVHFGTGRPSLYIRLPCTPLACLIRCNLHCRPSTQTARAQAY